jgi:hypothetical protein
MYAGANVGLVFATEIKWRFTSTTEAGRGVGRVLAGPPVWADGFEDRVLSFYQNLASYQNLAPYQNLASYQNFPRGIQDREK